MKNFLFSLSVCIALSYSLNSQNQRAEGKIIKSFGQTFEVENIDIKTDISSQFKVIFDVSQSSDDKSVINKYIVTAARFLNMHANEGMKKEQLKVAMTIHGGAWQDVLNNKAYKEKYGVDNPNLKLINELTEAGADIIICGQTAKFRGRFIPKCYEYEYAERTRRRTTFVLCGINQSRKASVFNLCTNTVSLGGN